MTRRREAARALHDDDLLQGNGAEVRQALAEQSQEADHPRQSSPFAGCSVSPRLRGPSCQRAGGQVGDLSFCPPWDSLSDDRSSSP